MRIILLNRIPKLGRIGDVVSVRDGYARNYLLPRRSALRATAENIAYFEKRREEIEALNLKQHAAAEEIAQALDGKIINSIQNAGESNQLYGSVNAREIAKMLAELNISIHHNQVILNTPIKTLGLHPVKLNLHGDVFATILVNAARNEEEAKLQLARAKAKREAQAINEIPDGSPGNVPEAEINNGKPHTDNLEEPPTDTRDNTEENRVT